MAGDDIYFSVWEGLLRAQRKSRFINIQLGSQPGQADAQLSIGEALILLIIESEPDINVRDIATAMQLERSWVSRIVADLEKRRFIQSVISPSDRRNKMIRIARKGQQELEKLNIYRAAVIAETYRDLTDVEEKELIQLLKEFADGLRAPAYVTHSGSHPIDVELARISWMTGIAGENFMGSRLNVNKYHVLFELSLRAGETVSASDLAAILPFDMSTISRILVGFEKDGLVKRVPSPADARLMLVHTTEKGIERWKEIRGKAIEGVRSAFRHSSQARLKRLAELFGKGTAQMPTRVRRSTGKRMEVRPVGNDEMENFVRVVLEKKRSQDARKLVSALDDFKGKTYGLYDGIDLSGLIRFVRARGKGQPATFVILGRDLEEKDCEILIRTSLKLSGVEGRKA